MTAFVVLFARELRGFAVSPWTYLAAAGFAAAAGLLAFPPGAVERGLAADPSGFTAVWPWLLAPLGAALGCRVWARERRTGSLSLLLSQPNPIWMAAAAKALAAWAVLCLCLLTILPLWAAAALAVPLDLGALLGAMIGAALLGGFYVGVGVTASSLVSQEPTAFTLALLASLAVTVPALPPEGAPAWLAALGPWSPATGFAAARLGVLQGPDLFLSLAAMGLCVGLSVIAIGLRRAG